MKNIEEQIREYTQYISQNPSDDAPAAVVASVQQNSRRRLPVYIAIAASLGVGVVGVNSVRSKLADNPKYLTPRYAPIDVSKNVQHFAPTFLPGGVSLASIDESQLVKSNGSNESPARILILGTELKDQITGATIVAQGKSEAVFQSGLTEKERTRESIGGRLVLVQRPEGGGLDVVFPVSGCDFVGIQSVKVNDANALVQLAEHLECIDGEIHATSTPPRVEVLYDSEFPKVFPSIFTMRFSGDSDIRFTQTVNWIPAQLLDVLNRSDLVAGGTMQKISGHSVRISQENNQSFASWSDGNALLSVSAAGLDKSELVKFVESVKPISETAWQEMLAKYPDPTPAPTTSLAMAYEWTQPSEAMVPTAAIGSRWKVLAPAEKVQRGDLVIVRFPPQPGAPAVSGSERANMKRVIAIPGDTIEIRTNVVIVNGEVVKEQFLAPGTVTESSLTSPIKLGTDEYFVMGDNRPNSFDSRALTVPLQGKDVLAKVVGPSGKDGLPSFPNP